MLKTDMNWFGSHPNHDYCPWYEGPPPKSHSMAQRAGSFFEFFGT